MSVMERSNVRMGDSDRQPLVFAHGFGCDQQMWRFVAPAFEASHRVVLFDHIGCGHADLNAYDERRHSHLRGYASDMVDIIEAADLRDAVLVGHSVSAMISMLAALQLPHRVKALVMVTPSPRYLNDLPGYVGGFERQDVEALIDMIDNNMLGWANFLAPAVLGSDGDPALTEELKSSFCALDPYVARRFAEVTFLADNRDDLAKLLLPTLIIQVSDDAIAPRSVGDYVHQRLVGSELAVIDGSGHCPHMTHPAETINLIWRFLNRLC
ncbi:alpha/beta fold hydrolase [Aquincola tertiaricarbonis]|uniref:alpha/beta fold hydrolase n=1 Tax=Aquincola tertiaricarbonis TaxID=391953 RepID=UPI00061540F4|nr:alpha/beta hydrolase [Aquincola tertiaricarbonis]